jgi:hypothetical protein
MRITQVQIYKLTLDLERAGSEARLAIEEVVVVLADDGDDGCTG